MKKILRLAGILFLCSFLSSCQRTGGTYLDYDTDASRFIDSSGIFDYTQKIAVINFVIQLKKSALWTKFVAVYPMVGGTPATTRRNLMNPGDADTSYRLTFHGTPVFAPTGVLFPTASDYADTHLTDEMLNYNDNSVSYYSVTQNTVSGYDLGCNDHAAPYNEMAIYHGSDASNWFGYYEFGPRPANTRGLFTLSSTASNVTRYENGAVNNSSGAAPVPGSTGFPLLIGIAGGAAAGGMRECALVTIGKGLTDEEALKFYTIVQNFEATLGR